MPTAEPVAIGAPAARSRLSRRRGCMITETDLDRMMFQMMFKEFGQLLPWKAVGENVANAQLD